MPVFLHTFQRENTYAKLHENAQFEMKNYKNFLERALRKSPFCILASRSKMADLRHFRF